MALTKRLYTNHQTVITAENMNDIQDAILELEQQAGIVPGEGESTKIVNVINSVGTMTAAEAAALPDGLYWVASPVTITDSTAAISFQLQGLAAKIGYTWLSYSTGQEGTTDENGVLTGWRYAALPQVTESDNGKVLSVQAGSWAVVAAESLFPDGDEVEY